MKYRRKGRDRKQEEKNSKVSENNYTMKEKKGKNEKIGEYILHSIKRKKERNAVYLLT